MMRRESQSDSYTRPESGRERPEVIVEFLFDAGMLFVSVNNIGNQPATGVAVKFSERITGPAGKDLSALPLFSSLQFLGPHREIVAFIDAANSYFSRKQPTKISVTVSYSDCEGNQYEVAINHDLEIYRELPYLIGRQGTTDCSG